VFYMGLSSCATIREQLLTHGKAGDTPVALIERGTQPSQRVIRGTSISCPRWRWASRARPSSWWDLW
jgi:uroporphyrin-III C-methyltransferase/precorrin-2 dehydrogenase/sirohydrochlorin ferrochelatase